MHFGEDLRFEYTVLLVLGLGLCLGGARTHIGVTFRGWEYDLDPRCVEALLSHTALEDATGIHSGRGPVGNVTSRVAESG